MIFKVVIVFGRVSNITEDYYLSFKYWRLESKTFAALIDIVFHVL